MKPYTHCVAQAMAPDIDDEPISVSFYPDFNCGADRVNQTYVQVLRALTIFQKNTCSKCANWRQRLNARIVLYLQIMPRNPKHTFDSL